MTEAEFAKEVRSLTLSGIYFLYGDEDYLKNHYIRDACEKFVSSDPMASFNLIRLDYGEGECRLDEIENALSAPPMMSPLKLIVVSFSSFDSIKVKGALNELLSAHADEGSMAVIVKASCGGFDYGNVKTPSARLKAMEKFAKCVRFDYKEPSKLFSWLSRHAADYGVKLSPAAGDYMMRTCGRSMYTLSGEIGKVSAYCAQNGINEIGVRECMLCCSRVDEDDAFGLANALTAGNTSEAYAILGVKIRLRQDPYMLLGQIAKTFTDLAAAALFISDGRDSSDYAKAMKMHPYRAESMYRSAKSASYAYFMNAVDLCLTADRNMKTMGNRGYGEIELLIARLSPAMFTEPEEDEDKKDENESKDTDNSRGEIRQGKALERN